MTGGYIMKEKNIQELAIRMGLISVEDMCQYTIAQLVTKIANKVNELVGEVWRFETDVQEILKTQNENIQYLLGEGLQQEATNILSQWVSDGTIDSLINQICVINNTMTIPQINELLTKNFGSYLFKSGDYHVTSDEGIIVNSNSHLIFEQGATIVQTTLNATHYDMVILKDVENVVIDNLQIRGERSNHIGTDGEWGHGVSIYSSKNVTLNHPKIESTWGDGVYIGLKYWEGYKFDNSNILINHPIICDCSRNGISVCSSKKVEIVSPYFKGINRTAPTSGIDIEPEHDTPCGVFLGEVKVTGVMTCIDCPHPFVTHIGQLSNSVVDIQIQDLVIKNCFQGVHINAHHQDVTGTIHINRISCDNIHYNALMVKNKPHSLKLNVGSISMGKRKIKDHSENGEYGACVWLTSDCEFENLGNIHIVSFKLDDLDSYDTALRVDGVHQLSDVCFNDIHLPPFNSYKNPIKIYKANKIKINHLYPHRDVVYGTPNVWYSTTYCKHMVYSSDLTLDQTYFLTIEKDLPDGEYQVTFLSNNLNTHFLQINPGDGLEGAGFNNVQMMNRGASVTFLKQNNKLYIINRNDITVN